MRNVPARVGWQRRVRRATLLVFLPGVLVALGAGEFGRFANMARGSNLSLEEYTALAERLGTAVSSIQRLLDAPAEDPAWDTLVIPAPAPEAPPPAEQKQTVEQRAGRLRLDGVAWNEDAPVAFVNGKLMTSGSTIEGLKVTAIRPEGVVLADEEGNTTELGLYEEPAPPPDTAVR